MDIAASGIAKDVRVAIDENTVVKAFVDDNGDTFETDTLEMDDIIISKIVDGINYVRKIAPLSILGLTRVTPSVRWTDTDKCIGSVSLPTDFMRLALFQMSDWLYGVTESISPVSEAYGQQFSEWAGVRGSCSRPVVALSADVDGGGGTLEFFSCSSTSATATLLYVPCLTQASSSYKIEDVLYHAVVLKTAALVAASYGNGELQQVLDNLCKEQLPE